MRRVVVRLGLLLAGTVFALLAAEAVVRLAAPHSRDHVLPSGMFVMDDTLGWRLGAGQTGRHRTRYFDVVYETNRAGFRDRQRDDSGPSVAQRMLVFGDSQVFGWGVGEERRFTALLEARTPGLEVWNLAVPGYGLDQQIVSFTSLAVDRVTDRAVFYISRSALRRSTTGKNYKKFKPRFLLDDEGVRLVPVPAGANQRTDLLYRALSPFYLPYFLERRLGMLKALRSDRSDGLSRASGEALSDLDEALVRHAIASARARDIEPLMLVSLPQPARDRLRRLCADQGVSTLEIDLSGLENARFGPHDRHWTEEAHDLVARQMQTQLEAVLSRGR